MDELLEVAFCSHVTPSMITNSHVTLEGVSTVPVLARTIRADTVTGKPVSTSLLVEEIYGTTMISSMVSIIDTP